MTRLFYILPYWLLLFLVRQVVILAGFVITPVALLFATERDTYRIPKWDGKRVVLAAESDKWALYQVEGRFYYNLQIWAFGGLFRLGHKVFPKYNGRDWSSDPLAAIKGFTFCFDKG